MHLPAAPLLAGTTSDALELSLLPAGQASELSRRDNEGATVLRTETTQPAAIPTDAACQEPGAEPDFEPHSFAEPEANDSCLLVDEPPMSSEPAMSGQPAAFAASLGRGSSAEVAAKQLRPGMCEIGIQTSPPNSPPHEVQEPLPSDPESLQPAGVSLQHSKVEMMSLPYAHGNVGSATADEELMQSTTGVSASRLPSAVTVEEAEVPSFSRTSDQTHAAGTSLCLLHFRLLTPWYLTACHDHDMTAARAFTPT